MWKAASPSIQHLGGSSDGDRACHVGVVLWDYDGTLVDTRTTDEAAVAELVLENPGAAEGVGRFWATEGRPIVERLELAWPGRSAEILPMFDRDVRPTLYPGVRRTLTALRARGVRQGVVSSRRLEPLRAGLRASELAEFFGIVVGLDSVSACKPDPEGLGIALRALDAPPQLAVYIGDRDTDIEAAVRAGVGAWHAAWGHIGETDTLVGAAVRLARPSEVLARLSSLNGGRTAA